MIRKIVTAGVALSALAVAPLATTTPVQAREGGAIAAGVIGGLALGAIAGSAASNSGYGYGGYPAYAPAYAPPPPVYGPPCYLTRQATYDPYGNFAGYRRVRVCQ